MTWVKLDDQFAINRKVAGASDAAYRLHVDGLCWVSRNLTDGRIGKGDLAQVSLRPKAAVVAELVRRELWHTAGYSCPGEHCPKPGPDGWVIHDYLQFNPTREEVLAERAAKAERQRKWQAAQKQRRNAATKPSANASQDTPADAPQDGLGDASRDGPEDALLTHAPSPPRPAPKGSGEGTSPKRPAARRVAAERTDGGREEDHQPSPNGKPPPDLLSDLRSSLRSVAAAQRRGLRADPMAELRELTPEIPPPTAAEESA